eukprot:symbB.v1.2.004132.t1/scaffold232.1/size259024/9
MANLQMERPHVALDKALAFEAHVVEVAEEHPQEQVVKMVEVVEEHPPKQAVELDPMISPKSRDLDDAVSVIEVENHEGRQSSEEVGTDLAEQLSVEDEDLPQPSCSQGSRSSSSSRAAVHVNNAEEAADLQRDVSSCVDDAISVTEIENSERQGNEEDNDSAEELSLEPDDDGELPQPSSSQGSRFSFGSPAMTAAPVPKNVVVVADEEEADRLPDLHSRHQDPVMLANRLAFAIMSSDSLELAEPTPQISRGISEGALTHASSLHSRDFARLISVASSDHNISEPGQFKRGFTEDDLAVTLNGIFTTMGMERLPLFELLCDLGHGHAEARMMELQILPLLPSSQDGTVSCDELLRFLAQPMST